jgi:Mn2+/Fe2+ NRAMP family transporter
MAKGKRGQRQNFIKRFFAVLGPGLITGAADDDPSGIATYSIAGAIHRSDERKIAPPS